jgi:hypothetical protein
VCHPKHVEQLRNIRIINSITRLHFVGSFYGFYITMHGSMNSKFCNLIVNDVNGAAYIFLAGWRVRELDHVEM